MILKNEDQLLDIQTRKRIIQDIDSQENRMRKSEMYKRYQCYKDKTAAYVIAYLLKQFDRDTVNEMMYCVSNLGLSRKVVDKLARVYKYGVDRDLYVNGEEVEDELVHEVERILHIDQNLKKTNRFFKLFKNVALYIRPKPVSPEADALMTIKLTPLAPYLYDVVEMADEREKPLAFILSNYAPTRGAGSTGVAGLAVVPGTDGRNGNVIPMVHSGDGIDQSIADSVEDQDVGTFTFWSSKYHFVCNAQGQIISEGDGLNPIERLPFVNYAEDQDGGFWAQGGDDLTDGAILVNSMITNINHIAITQGYGQMVLTGKDLPKLIKVGPNKAIRLTHEGEDPVPTFAFASANPPLDQLRALVEMYVALLLTTNNLSTNGVSSNLNGGASFPSGIAMLLDKAESMEDVEDQRQVFVDNEPAVWELIAKWHTLLKSKGELVPELQPLTFPEDFEVRVSYNDPKPIESEKERLDVIKLRLDMGLMSMIDAIKEENPGISDDEAEEKLKEIMEEKMAKMAAAMGGQGESNGDGNNGQSNDGEDRAGGQPPGRGEAGSGRVPRGAGSPEGSESPESGNG